MIVTSPISLTDLRDGIDLVSKGLTFLQAGRNPDIDKASVPETIWPEGGLYQFQTSASKVDIASTLGGDTMNIRILGQLDGIEFNEIIKLTGIATVQTENDFDIIYRVEAIGVTVNAGDITGTFTGSGDVAFKIEAGTADAAMMIYQVPSQLANGIKVSKAYLVAWDYYVYIDGVSTQVEIDFFVKKSGESFRLKDTIGLNVSGIPPGGFIFPYELDVGDCLDFRAVTVTANNLGISGKFFIVLKEL